jgi:hypothetical protein
VDGVDTMADVSTPEMDLPAAIDGAADTGDAAGDRGIDSVSAIDTAPDAEVGGPSCGDRTVTPPEECDLGAAMNTGAYGGCTSGCKYGPRCGDGTKNGPEQCDNGSANNDTTYNGCKLNCTFGPRCGDGHQDSGEECDQGGANSANAYGRGLCTDACKTAPYCGDGKTNGAETCDGGGSGSTDLGACNPECSGYFQKKVIRETAMYYSGKLGGPHGADLICQTELGAGWKALLVGGGRRATMTPNKGDGQLDWVVRKFTHYYNINNELVWRTDGAALLGVTNGQRLNVYADAFLDLSFYPWGGYDDGWVEVPRNVEIGKQSGTCLGWTSEDSAEPGTFATVGLKMGRQEFCGGAQPLLCIEQ